MRVEGRLWSGMCRLGVQLALMVSAPCTMEAGWPFTVTAGVPTKPRTSSTERAR